MRELSADEIRFDDRGLVPAVVQDAGDGTVLMVGYMNAEALARTRDTGDVWFWSRSRGALWHKGETSGNYLRLVEIRVDCDGDALLVRATPAGPTCHTGERSCFFGHIPPEVAHPQPAIDDRTALERLWAVIEDRKAHPEPGSYTSHLLSAGVDRIGRKIGEEAAETIIAAKNHAPSELTAEVADLFYHTLVLLAAEDVSLHDVYAELIRRHGAPRRFSEQPAT
ncbi:MAG TPA: bifunctional phosphoribosyl-AMP cyclohydrolase/phosphoribosyl-ATP diphosphatase HisIE [Chloroflexota bacterium]|jgi:phosphoribosyl-ATP pyrophosphohydrolase/phosphoribosyl-AMP cyclohydrolase|nr:bifunctional phosphoribosyl-AMP cyclohydrolase/phosphoribosyl-ATP diphosphatase HisIE [Chloroflexota bacterium]